MTPHGAENEPNDPLIESCLDEVLGGHAPPNLKDQILASHADGEKHVTPPPAPAAPPVQAAVGSIAVSKRRDLPSAGLRVGRE